MGREYKGKHIRSRPNSVCLACNGTLKETTHARAFYTCSEFCRRAIGKGISSLSMPNIRNGVDVKRRYSQNGYQLACAYFILKHSNEPLSGLEVMDRVRNNFGRRRLFKTNTFNNMFSYFGDNIQRNKVNGRYEYHVVDKTVPFNEVLKAKYGDYLFENKV
jgi:hypothetical protein